MCFNTNIYQFNENINIINSELIFRKYKNIPFSSFWRCVLCIRLKIRCIGGLRAFLSSIFIVSYKMMSLITPGSKIKMVMHNFCVFLNILVHNINVNIIPVLARTLIGSNLKSSLGATSAFIKEDIFAVDLMFGQLHLFPPSASHPTGTTSTSSSSVNSTTAYFNFFDLIICETKLKLFFFLDKHIDYCININ